MSWEVGGPTDKSGPAYRGNSKRQFLKHLGAGAIGFGGGAFLTRGYSEDGVVTAFGTTNGTGTEEAPNETISTTIPGAEPRIAEVLSVEANDGQRKFALVTVAIANPLEEVVRRGLYSTLRHEPYESSGDRVVELPPQSVYEYVLRVPRGGRLRTAIISAIQNDDHEIDVSLGSLPERYGDT